MGHTLAMCAAASSAKAATPSRASYDFETSPLGQPPPGFQVARTGRGARATWVVQTDTASGGRVLSQSSEDATNLRFPLCIADGPGVTNVELSVRIKPRRGRVDQAGGLVWRYVNVNNYYVVRANALEDNVVMYKLEGGERSHLKPVGATGRGYGRRATVPRGTWSTLRVKVHGNRFSVWLNGVHLYDVVDDTFAGAGKVGLWTKADSVTSFDDFFIDVVTD